jgi:hypothetical protein
MRRSWVCFLVMLISVLAAPVIPAQRAAADTGGTRLGEVDLPPLPDPVEVVCAAAGGLGLVSDLVRTQCVRLP